MCDVKIPIYRNFYRYFPHRWARFLPIKWGGLGLEPLCEEVIPKDIVTLIRIRESAHTNMEDIFPIAVVANYILRTLNEKKLMARGKRLSQRLSEL
jgi:hypothetical protein